MSHAQPSCSLNAQRGIGIAAIFIIIAVVSFFVMLAFKLAPAYMEFANVRKVMDDVAQNPEAKSQRTALMLIENQFYINDVRSVGRKDFVAEKTRVGFDLSIDYEVRVPMMANVDAVMRFAHAVEFIPK